MVTPTVMPPVYSKRYTFKRLDLSSRRVMTEAFMEEDKDSRLTHELDRCPQLRTTLDLYSHYSKYLRGMVLDLTGWILRDSHEHELVTKEAQVPATWWDMLVRDKFPLWWKKRWPIKTKVQYFTFEQQVRVCPHADIAWPDPAHLDFITFEMEGLPNEQSDANALVAERTDHPADKKHEREG